MKNSFNDYIIKLVGKKDKKSFYEIYQGDKYITTVHGSRNVRAWLTAEVLSRAAPVMIGKGK